MAIHSHQLFWRPWQPVWSLEVMKLPALANDGPRPKGHVAVTSNMKLPTAPVMTLQHCFVCARLSLHKIRMPAYLSLISPEVFCGGYFVHASGATSRAHHAVIVRLIHVVHLFPMTMTNGVCLWPGDRQRLGARTTHTYRQSRLTGQATARS